MHSYPLPSPPPPRPLPEATAHGTLRPAMPLRQYARPAPPLQQQQQQPLLPHGEPPAPAAAPSEAAPEPPWWRLPAGAPRQWYMSPRDNYAVTSALAGLYALFFLTPLLAACVGDKKFVLRLPLWFCWQPAAVYVFGAASNPFGIRLNQDRVGMRWQLAAKLVLAGAFFMQDLTFAVLACVHWAQHPAAAIPFMSAAAVFLFWGAFLAALLLFATVWSQLKSRHSAV